MKHYYHASLLWTLFTIYRLYQALRGWKEIWIRFLSYDQQRARLLVSNEKYGHIFANLKKQLDSNIWAKYNCKNGCLYEAWSHFRACDHTLYSSTSDSRNIDTLKQVAFPLTFSIVSSISQKTFNLVEAETKSI